MKTAPIVGGSAVVRCPACDERVWVREVPTLPEAVVVRCEYGCRGDFAVSGHNGQAMALAVKWKTT